MIGLRFRPRRAWRVVAGKLCSFLGRCKCTLLIVSLHIRSTKHSYHAAEYGLIWENLFWQCYFSNHPPTAKWHYHRITRFWKGSFTCFVLTFATFTSFFNSLSISNQCQSYLELVIVRRRQILNREGSSPSL